MLVIIERDTKRKVEFECLLKKISKGKDVEHLKKATSLMIEWLELLLTSPYLYVVKRADPESPVHLKYVVHFLDDWNFVLTIDVNGDEVKWNMTYQTDVYLDMVFRYNYWIECWGIEQISSSEENLAGAYEGILLKSEEAIAELLTLCIKFREVWLGRERSL